MLHENAYFMFPGWIIGQILSSHDESKFASKDDDMTPHGHSTPQASWKDIPNN